jgi:hypothetical protein
MCIWYVYQRENLIKIKNIDDNDAVKAKRFVAVRVDDRRIKVS